MKKAGMLSVLAIAAVGILSACEPPPQARAAPAPSEVSEFELTAQEADTFSVAATWTPVVFGGDTIRSFQRSSMRTDSAGYVTVDTIEAVGSELLDVPSPPPGTTHEFRYCLRSQNQFGLSSDSTCASYSYTNPDTLPPPPDSVEVEPPTAMAFDSMRLYVDGRLYEEGQRDTIGIDEQIPYAAVLYRDDHVIGCSGDCEQFAIYPGEWRDGVPIYIAGRPGYDVGEEWAPARLPWLRRYYPAGD